MCVGRGGGWGEVEMWGGWDTVVVWKKNIGGVNMWKCAVEWIEIWKEIIRVE